MEVISSYSKMPIIKNNYFYVYNITNDTMDRRLLQSWFDIVAGSTVREFYMESEYVSICDWIDSLDKRGLLLNTNHELVYIRKWCLYRLKYNCKVIRT